MIFNTALKLIEITIPANEKYDVAELLKLGNQVLENRDTTQKPT